MGNRQNYEAMFPIELRSPAMQKRHRDIVLRRGRFIRWMDEKNRNWWECAIEDYERMLHETHSAYTRQVYVAAVRTRYQELLDNEEELGRLLKDAFPNLSHDELTETIRSVKSRIYTALMKRPKGGKAERPSKEHHYLTREQVETLLSQPNPQSLSGLRDLAVISLMVCTGLRESEIAALSIDDLDGEVDGHRAIHVSGGTGRVERLVILGEADWVLKIVEQWLSVAKIRGGAVFRGFYASGKIRKPPLSGRAIRDILNSYPIEINGKSTAVTPLDLRHTYAQRLYESGVDFGVIQQNLGFSSATSVINYIRLTGTPTNRGLPPPLYTFDLTTLKQK